MNRNGHGIFRGAALLMIALLAFSCKKTVDVSPTRGLSLSDDTTVDFDGTSASLTIRAKSDWMLAVTSGGDWISTPEVTSGKAGTTETVEFPLAKNNGQGQRTGTVTVRAAGESESYVFTITQNSQSVLTEINKWIYDELSDNYYWNDVVKATSPPSSSLAYDAFLESMIDALPWNRVQDTSNGENPATIDGAWLSDLSGRDHIYSYIDRVSAATRADESTATTFGFDFEPVGLSGRDGKFTGQYLFIVRWVMSGSPADKAGLKRGAWITKYFGADITRTEYEQFWYRLHYQQGGTTMVFSDENGKSYNLTAVEMKVSPILHREVITTGKGKKAAYLVYNAFERGERVSGDRYEFDNELRDAFGEFKSAGATELVLDLRYNSGGYVSSCQVLTSLIAAATTSDTFIKMKRNTSSGRSANPEVLKFRNETNSLKLRKIYVLCTDHTASASEMVISSLRGLYGDASVVHIGGVTNGKNVGMDLSETTIGGLSYEMWPITFKVLNSKDFCDYAGGFAPNYAIDELRDAVDGDVLYQFGDRNERLLKAALTLIDGGTVTSDTRTRAADPEREQVQSLRDPRRGGAKYIPDTQQ